MVRWNTDKMFYENIGQNINCRYCKSGLVLSRMAEYDAIIGFVIVLVTVLVPFGIAMYFLGGIKSRLNTLESDVKDLKREVRNIDIRTEAHILSRKLLEETKGGQ